MITEPTILILGAGASIPFGYPCGSALKKEIVSLSESDGELMRLLLASGFRRAEIVGFAKALGASLSSSLDRFLEFTPGDYRKVGCAAIAAEILLKSQGLEGQLDYDWMQFLFGALSPEFQKGLDNGQLVVVTFNYDCSFEYLLCKGLESSLEPERAKTTFERIRVIHLHGRIAPSKEPTELPTVAPEVILDSLSLNEGIRSFHEQNSDMGQFKAARTAIEAAKRVCFLGFGYDRVNLEHLLGSKPPDFTNKFVCGSAFECTEIENWNVNKEFFKGNFRFGKADWKASRLLRESGLLGKICSLPRQQDPTQ